MGRPRIHTLEEMYVNHLRHSNEWYRKNQADIRIRRKEVYYQKRFETIKDKWLWKWSYIVK